MSENKTAPTDASVSDFVAAVENQTRRADAETLLAMMGRISGEDPVMWGDTLIGFGQCKYHLIHVDDLAEAMILGATALSFLGLGLRAPAVSWGVMLNDAQNLASIEIYPWTAIPMLPIIIVVLAFNFLGDGLRDSLDPYQQ